MTSNQQLGHVKQIERILFSGVSGTPEWLKKAPLKCGERYKDIQLTDQFKAAISAFEDDKSPKPFELFVLGEGKFGKSTIVNCLLGQELSKVHGLPETRCFHRYIFRDSPSEFTNLFLRTKTKEHDWLTSKLDDGIPVKDLFEISRYRVLHSTALSLVKEENNRLQRGSYEQAIYEIEREVKKNDLSKFQRDIRIVDTQGLDQLFPDDLKSALQSNETSSRESCHNWMRESPRGLHLEWQFRRCDAVLWCINAKRLGSAATLEYLDYFSDYSKKIVIALTHIDIARSDREKDRLLSKAREKYGKYSDIIIPVNGKASWESVQKNDLSSYRSSGMSGLANHLIDLCDKDGTRVRNISRYKGLRQTERQYRNAISILKDDLFVIERKYKEDISVVASSQAKIKQKLLNLALKRGEAVRAEVLSGVIDISIWDSVSEAESKLKIHSKSRMLREYLSGLLEDILVKNISSLNESITPYHVPSFDADGEKSGNAVSHYVDTLRIDFKIDLPYPKLKLAGLLDKLKDVLDGFLSIFSKEAEKRKEQRLKDLQVAIYRQVDESWDQFHVDIEDNLNRETERQFDSLFNAIKAVMDKICRDAGGTVPATIRKIDHALEGVAVPNVVISKMLSVCKNQFYLKKR